MAKQICIFNLKKIINPYIRKMIRNKVQFKINNNT